MNDKNIEKTRKWIKESGSAFFWTVTIGLLLVFAVLMLVGMIFDLSGHSFLMEFVMLAVFSYWWVPVSLIVLYIIIISIFLVVYSVYDGSKNQKMGTFKVINELHPIIDEQVTTYGWRHTSDPIYNTVTTSGPNGQMTTTTTLVGYRDNYSYKVKFSDGEVINKSGNVPDGSILTLSKGGRLFCEFKFNDNSLSEKEVVLKDDHYDRERSTLIKNDGVSMSYEGYKLLTDKKVSKKRAKSEGKGK